MFHVIQKDSVIRPSLDQQLLDAVRKAGRNGSLDVVKSLLAKGANPNGASTSAGLSSMAIAGLNLNLELATLLKANGATAASTFNSLYNPHSLLLQIIDFMPAEKTNFDADLLLMFINEPGMITGPQEQRECWFFNLVMLPDYPRPLENRIEALSAFCKQATPAQREKMFGYANMLARIPNLSSRTREASPTLLDSQVQQWLYSPENVTQIQAGRKSVEMRLFDDEIGELMAQPIGPR